MLKPLLPLFLLTLLTQIPVSQSYTTQVSIDETSSKTITYFNTDLASCSCDISTACDTFCCCDTICGTEVVSKWTTSGWCIDTAAEIEKMCEKIGTKGFSTFEDLGCVMYTNRGAIGEYYATPSANNIVDPNIQKFSTFNMNAQGINQYTVPSTSTYQQYSPLKLKIDGIEKSLITWVPSLGEACRQNYVPLSEGTTTSTCLYSVINSESCQNLNAEIVGANFLYCQYGHCGTTVALSNTPGAVGASTYVNGTCSGAVTGIDIKAVISYTSGQYRIVSGSIIFTISSITTKKAIITTKISITKAGVESSGNPGYLQGKPLKYGTGGIYQIADTANGACIPSSSPSSSLLDIKFGVNQTFYCLTTTPCQASLYIDQIPLANSFKLLKYATQSVEEIAVTGLSSSSCLTQQFTLYIMYSYSGWILDPQYYILGSTIIKETTSNTNLKMKKLAVKWVKVDPGQVNTPPTNYFYTYFSLLWEPLKSKFYQFSKRL